MEKISKKDVILGVLGLIFVSFVSYTFVLILFSL